MAAQNCGGLCSNPNPCEITSDELLKGLQQSSEDARSPWKSPSSEQEFRHALSALYLSTYRADYLGTHKGLQMKYGIAPAPRKKKIVPQCFVTEMKHSYKHPQKLAKLKNNTSRYGCNTLHGVYAKGIVPTIVHDNKRNQETRKPLNTKSKQTGGKTVGNQGILTSPQPSEHQQLSECVAESGYVDKQVLEEAVQDSAPSSPAQGIEYLPAVHHQVSKHVPTWISEWPGPL